MLRILKMLSTYFTKIICVYALIAPMVVQGQSVYVVDTDETGFSPVNGTLTLEMALNSAVDGDSILIDYSGSLVLTNTLNITTGVTIIGPMPSHFSIDGTNVTSAEAVRISAPGSSVEIRGIKLEGYSSSVTMLNAFAAGNVKIVQCQFSENSSPMGSALSVDNVGNMQVINSSFYQNGSATGQGGAVYKSGSGVLNFENCSFLTNTANEGGAVYSDGTTQFVHCTFYNNFASSQGGAVFVGAASSQTYFQSCLLDQSNGAGFAKQVLNSGGAVSDGYNTLDDDQGCTGVFSQATDMLGVGSVGLRPAGPKEDGYGMWWIPITGLSSPAINNGGPSSVMADGRRAPRVLGGVPDVGAIEFTPYTVKNNGIGTGNIGSLEWAIALANSDLASPAYIDFDIPGPSAIANSMPYIINTFPMIIDGFTQETSLIPGPQIATMPATTGYISIVVDGISSSSDGLVVSPGMDNCKISGITFVNLNNAIVLQANNAHIFGNHFGTNEPANDASNSVMIGVQGSGQGNFIGGSAHFERNVFGGCSNLGVEFVPSALDDHIIMGNFFGLPGEGVGTYTNPSMNDGIRVSAGNNCLITDNFFGNMGNGIIATGGITGLRILNNMIGVQADYITPATMLGNGIDLLSVSFADVGLANDGNVVCSCTSAGSRGISIGQSSDVNVIDNFVGLLPDGASVSGNHDGIFLHTNSSYVSITGNYISGNNNASIVIDASNWNTVASNLIGLDVNGIDAGIGNGGGIDLFNSADNLIGGPGQGNIISACSGGSCIRLGGLGSINNTVQANYLGYEADYSTIVGNGGVGIDLAAPNNQIGGISSEANFIAGAAFYGIHINSDGANNDITNNQITGSGSQGIWVDGTNAIQNRISRNPIFSNGGLGIELSAGGNNSVIEPTLVGVTECTPGTSLTARVELSGLTLGNSYEIEVFHIPAGQQDPSGFGEGNIYIHTETVSASVSGAEQFTFTIPVAIPAGDLISCTIIHPDNNTSDFSNHVTIAAQTDISSFISTDPSCPGNSDGAIDITVSGGYPTYSYLYEDGGGSPIANTEDATGLPADTYTITVTDTTGCAAMTNITLSNPSSIIASSTYTDITCFGASDGSITTTISGGTGPYDISYDNGATFTVTGIISGHTESGFAAGTYLVVVQDANGCLVSGGTITINEPSALIATATGTDVSCNGACDGTLAGTAAGGTPGYTFNWDNGIGTTANATNVCPNTYTLTVTDANGCVDTDFYTVNEPSAVNVIVSSYTEPSCYGFCDGSITLSGSGGDGGPYTYSIDGGTSWQSGTTYNSQCAQTYTGIMIQDGTGCGYNLPSYALTEPPALTVSVTPTDVTCNGAADGVLNISISGGTANYLISFDGGATYPVTGVTGSHNETGLSGGNYDVVVQDANGCIYSSPTVTINEPAALGHSTTVVDASCNGTCDGSITVNATGGTAPLQYSIDNGSTFQASNVFSGLCAGTYPLVIEDANSCQTNSSEIVNQPTTMSLNTPSTVDPSCNGFCDGQVTLSVLGGGVGPYQYSIDGGSTWQTGTTFTGICAGTYSSGVAMDANGCTANFPSYTLSDPAPITVDAGTDQFVCANNSNATLNGSVAVASGGVWSGGAGTFSPSNTALNATYTPTAGEISGGSLTLTLTSTGNGSCPSVADNMTITFTPAPTVDAGTQQTVCETNSPTVSAIVTVASGVSWSTSGDGSISSPTSNTTQYNLGVGDIASGSVWLYATTTGNGTCNAVTDSVELLIEQAPDAGGSNSFNACVESGTYDLSSYLGGTPDGGGTWTDVTPTGGLTGSVLDVTGIPAGTYTYDYTVTGVVCPSDQSTITVSLQGLDDPSFMYDDLCLGGTSGGYNEATPGGTYTFYTPPGDGAIVNASNGTLTNYTGGTTYIIEYTTNGTCPDSDTIHVTVYNPPIIVTASTTTTDPTCYGSNDGTITINANGEDMYSIDNGATLLASSTFSALGGGNYDLVVYNSNTGCYSSTYQVILNEPAEIIQSVSSTNVSCNGNNDGEIDVSFTGGSGSTSVTIDNGLSFTTTGSPVNFNGLASGQFIVFTQDVNGCTSAPDTISITEPAPISFDLTVTDVCLPDSGSIVFSNVAGGTGPYQYSIDGGTTFSGDTSYLVIIGTYQLSVEDVNGCSKDSTATVQLTQVPAPVITAQNPYCDGQGTISASGAGIITWYSHLWIPLGASSTINIPAGYPNGAEIYAVQDIGGCSSLPDTAVLVIVPNDLVMGPDVFACPGDSVDIYVTGSGTFNWTSTTNVGDASVANTAAAAQSDMWLTVQMTINGCVFEDSLYLDIDDSPDCGLTINNAFSPNGDGINDTWIIGIVDGSVPNTVTIFNRWGDVIRKIENYNNMDVIWDGTDMSGNELPNGTYYYVIDIPDSELSQAGWVQITK